MNKNFQELLNLAEHNVQHNPSIVGQESAKVTKCYLDGLADEVREVESELKCNNTVHLVDELCDIAWDYFVLLKVCEDRGWIESVEDVFAHGLEKYSERSPAFFELDDNLWTDIKAKQKERLARKHLDKHGE